MTPADLLATLRAEGVILTADGDRLIVDAPRGTLDDDRRAALATHKAELLGLLEAEQSALRKADATANGWATITLLWPATSKVPCPKGKWKRLDDGTTEATYTRQELRDALALAGVDVAALEAAATPTLTERKAP